MRGLNDFNTNERTRRIKSNSVSVPMRGLNDFNSEIEFVLGDPEEVSVPMRGLNDFNIMGELMKLNETKEFPSPCGV